MTIVIASDLSEVPSKDDIVKQMPRSALRELSDDELLRRLAALLSQSRRIEWELIAHIGEVEERRLFAREACDSMFVYCTEVLHLSEHEAYLRIAAARAAREHPVLLAMLGDGRLHLSGIAKLAPHLTPANRDVLLERATHKSKRQIEVLVADLAPRPDVPALIRKLPDRGPTTAAVSSATPSGDELGPDPVSTTLSDSLLSRGPLTTPSVPGRPSGLVEPLGSSRFKVQFTASAAFCDKIERLKALMVSSVPDGDLARILETAVTEALERREARRSRRSRRRGRHWRTRAAPPRAPATFRRRCGGAPIHRTMASAALSAPAGGAAAPTVTSSSITSWRGRAGAILHPATSA